MWPHQNPADLNARAWVTIADPRRLQRGSERRLRTTNPSVTSSSLSPSPRHPADTRSLAGTAEATIFTGPVALQRPSGHWDRPPAQPTAAAKPPQHPAPTRRAEAARWQRESPRPGRSRRGPARGQASGCRAPGRAAPASPACSGRTGRAAAPCWRRAAAPAAASPPARIARPGRGPLAPSPRSPSSPRRRSRPPPVGATPWRPGSARRAAPPLRLGTRGPALPAGNARRAREFRIQAQHVGAPKLG